jgi:D-serine deaminase-like pyridoxal phosphate-dependent protein
MNLNNIEKPALLLNVAAARRNIARMADKARRSGVRLRPHFKTHQSAEVGEWFRAEGTTAITVSSVSMARYFAAQGWRDITIAFPVNWREIQKINKLAAEIDLHLLVESLETVQFLQDRLTAPVGVWLKIDTGYARTGMQWDDAGAIAMLADAIRDADKLTLKGVLTHAGHSYHVHGTGALQAVYDETVERMAAARGDRDIAVSVGDTPCCSAVDDLSEVDEIRPGNYVFYDLTQLYIGACAVEDIAVALACPVVAKHRKDHKLIVYGGGVHLSKDRMTEDGVTHFGRPVYMTEDGWGDIVSGSYVTSISQEHGVLHVNPAFFNSVNVGDLVLILPVHSCMTADLLKQYVTLNGDVIEMMK